MNLTTLTEVWTPISALMAVVAGIAMGICVGWAATNPLYSSGIATAIRIATLTTSFVAGAGLLFFALQALGSYLSNDPNWPRAMSRYGQWVLFSFSTGVTTWIQITRDRSRRRHRAHDIAVTQNASAS